MTRAHRPTIATSSHALDDTLIVEAAAGTGKTTELVARIVRLIQTGRARIDRDRRGDVQREGGRRAQAAAARGAGAGPGRAAPLRTEAAPRLDDAVHEFEEAHVSTIHGFCADLLRERPVEARIDPAFEVLTETQAIGSSTRPSRPGWRRRCRTPAKACGARCGGRATYPGGATRR